MSKFKFLKHTFGTTHEAGLQTECDFGRLYSQPGSKTFLLNGALKSK